MRRADKDNLKNLYDLWEQPKSDGKPMYAQRSAEERLQILKNLNLSGHEIIANAQHPGSPTRYKAFCCYADGTLRCRSTEDIQLISTMQRGPNIGKDELDLFPQFIDVVDK